LKFADKTSEGGWGGAFRTTHWTEILRARTHDEARRQAVLSEVLGRYWKPVYYCLSRKGFDRERAKDLTQDFFCEVVLGRDLVQQADREKGRFRTFLLTALDRYVTDVHRAERAEKRMPRAGLVRLKGDDRLSFPEQLQCGGPAEAFDYAWASALLDEVIAEVARGCQESGMAAHWEVFRARVLQPIMENAAPPSLTELCARFGVSDEVKASNMIVTIKRRFRAVLERRVREFVNSEAEVEEEIDDLVEALARSRAGS